MLARIWSNKNFHPSLVGRKNGTATLGDSVAGSYKVNIVSPYDIAIALLDIYSNELKTVLTKT